MSASVELQSPNRRHQAASNDRMKRHAVVVLRRYQDLTTVEKEEKREEEEEEDVRMAGGTKKIKLEKESEDLGKSVGVGDEPEAVLGGQDLGESVSFRTEPGPGPVLGGQDMGDGGRKTFVAGIEMLSDVSEKTKESCRMDCDTARNDVVDCLETDFNNNISDTRDIRKYSNNNNNQNNSSSSSSNSSSNNKEIDDSNSCNENNNINIDCDSSNSINDNHNEMSSNDSQSASSTDSGIIVHNKPPIIATTTNYLSNENTSNRTSTSSSVNSRIVKSSDTSCSISSSSNNSNAIKIASNKISSSGACTGFTATTSSDSNVSRQQVVAGVRCSVSLREFFENGGRDYNEYLARYAQPIRDKEQPSNSVTSRECGSDELDRAPSLSDSQGGLQRQQQQQQQQQQQRQIQQQHDSETVDQRLQPQQPLQVVELDRTQQSRQPQQPLQVAELDRAQQSRQPKLQIEVGELKNTRDAPRAQLENWRDPWSYFKNNVRRNRPTFQRPILERLLQPEPHEPPQLPLQHALQMQQSRDQQRTNYSQHQHPMQQRLPPLLPLRSLQQPQEHRQQTRQQQQFVDSCERHSLSVSKTFEEETQRFDGTLSPYTICRSQQREAAGSRSTAAAAAAGTATVGTDRRSVSLTDAAAVPAVSDVIHAQGVQPPPAYKPPVQSCERGEGGRPHRRHETTGSCCCLHTGRPPGSLGENDVDPSSLLIRRISAEVLPVDVSLATVSASSLSRLGVAASLTDNTAAASNDLATTLVYVTAEGEAWDTADLCLDLSKKTGELLSEERTGRSVLERQPVRTGEDRGHQNSHRTQISENSREITAGNALETAGITWERNGINWETGRERERNRTFCEVRRETRKIAENSGAGEPRMGRVFFTPGQGVQQPLFCSGSELVRGPLYHGNHQPQFRSDQTLVRRPLEQFSHEPNNLYQSIDLISKPGNQVHDQHLKPSAAQSYLIGPLGQGIQQSHVRRQAQVLPHVAATPLQTTSASRPRNNLMTPFTSSSSDMMSSAAGSSDVDVRQWSVEQVARFVSTVPGCADYAESFRQEQLDGAALLSLSERHLLDVMRMKLGPSIRLRIAIENLCQNTS